jgi:nucleotide-binding universal stress UspA family protein
MDVTQANDRDLRSNMGAFEAALAAQTPEIQPIELRRILLLIDGSNQDELCIGLAKSLLARPEDELLLGYAYEGDRDETREQALRNLASSLQQEGLRARALERAAEAQLRSHQHILGMIDREQPQLVVCEAPYLEDFEALGTDSVGSNLDVLMARSPVPVLVVRDPAVDVQSCLSRVILPVTPWDAELVEAAAWSERILSLGGTLRLLAVVDEDRLRLAGVEEPFAIDEADEEMLAGLHKPALAGLVAAVQKRALEQSHNCRVSVRSGELPAIILRYVETRPGLIVAATPREVQSPLYQRTQALLRGSRWPVLIV